MNLHRDEADDGGPPEPEAEAAAAEALIPPVGPPPDLFEDFFVVLRQLLGDRSLLLYLLAGSGVLYPLFQQALWLEMSACM